MHYQTSVKANIFMDLAKQDFKWEVINSTGKVDKSVLGDFAQPAEAASLSRSPLPELLLAKIMTDYKEVYYETTFSEEMKAEVEIFFQDKEIIIIYVQ